MRFDGVLKYAFISLSLSLSLSLFSPGPARADVPKWAWADCGAGLASAETGPFSILIAACASMALTSVRPAHDGGGSATQNPMNRFDAMGALHNRIVDDYFKTYGVFELKNYYTLLKKNRARYGVTKLPSMDVLENAVATYGDRSISPDVLLSRIDAQMKAAGIKDDVVGRLRRLPPNTTRGELNASIVRIENGELTSKKLDKVQSEKLSIFFSVLRYSAAYSFPTFVHGKWILPSGPGPYNPGPPPAPTVAPRGGRRGGAERVR